MNGKLQQELKKKQPFQHPEEEVLLNLMRTHDHAAIRFERLFRSHGLTPAQYNILRILRGEGQPLPILEIAERTITVVPGITGLVDRLERQELVRRERSTQDRRVIFVALTPRAEKLLQSLDEPVQRLNQELAGHLSKAETQTMIRLLEKVRRACAQER